MEGSSGNPTDGGSGNDDQSTSERSKRSDDGSVEENNKQQAADIPVEHSAKGSEDIAEGSSGNPTSADHGASNSGQEEDRGSSGKENNEPDPDQRGTGNMEGSAGNPTDGGSGNVDQSTSERSHDDSVDVYHTFIVSSNVDLHIELNEGKFEVGDESPASILGLKSGDQLQCPEEIDDEAYLNTFNKKVGGDSFVWFRVKRSCPRDQKTSLHRLLLYRKMKGCLGIKYDDQSVITEVDPEGLGNLFGVFVGDKIKSTSTCYNGCWYNKDGWNDSEHHDTSVDIQNNLGRCDMIVELERDVSIEKAPAPSKLPIWYCQYNI